MQNNYNNECNGKTFAISVQLRCPLSDCYLILTYFINISICCNSTLNIPFFWNRSSRSHKLSLLRFLRKYQMKNQRNNSSKSISRFHQQRNCIQKSSQSFIVPRISEEKTKPIWNEDCTNTD